jgi:flagellar biosynthesis protein FlhA
MAGMSNHVEGWRQRGDVLVAVFVCVSVLMLLVPLPAVLLDFGMALNIGVSLLVLLIVLYARNTSEFSSFPTLLLLSTVFGLALNVSSTRLILSQGAAFDGRIVRAFGTFVVGSSSVGSSTVAASGAAGAVIGLIIFVIIIAVQVVVITKGSNRVAEVAARFTLDALPGRQMAIDAEYSSGRLSEAQARVRQQELQRQADFYGAMDGASKFVSGNVRVALFITAVNLAGGFLLGVSVHGEALASAAHHYVLLTIGDGLVTQLPALLIATATGIIVTRAASDRPFGWDVAAQLARYDRPFYITAAFLAVLALLPGFPPWLLLPMAAAVAGLGRAIGRSERNAAGAGAGAAGSTGDAPPQTAQGAATATAGATAAAAGGGGSAPVLPPPLSLELGYALLAATEGAAGADLLRGVAGVRDRAARDWGVQVPALHITDNLGLAPTAYVFKIRGVDAQGGRCRPGAGCTDTLVGGFGAVIERHAADLLGRDQVRAMIDELRETSPTVVEEAGAALSVGEIRAVLQGLLRERVSIRDLVTILEALADEAGGQRDVDYLVGRVRRALGRQISAQHSDQHGVLHVVTLAPELERELLAADAGPGAGNGAAAAFHRDWVDALADTLGATAAAGCRPALVASDELRALVKRTTERRMPELVCLAAGEVAAAGAVRRVAEVSGSAAGGAASGAGRRA